MPCGLVSIGDPPFSGDKQRRRRRERGEAEIETGRRGGKGNWLACKKKLK